MKLTLLSLMALLAGLAPSAAFAGADHALHHGKVAYEEVVNGVKATFSITRIADDLRAKGLTPPPGLKQTHHLGAAFVEVAGGKPLENGLVAVRVQGLGQSGEPMELTAMDGHFGIDLDLSRPGNYMFMCRFVLADGKKRQAMFRYVVK